MRIYSNLLTRKQPLQIYLTDEDKELIDEVCLDLRLKRSVFVGNAAIKEAKKLRAKVLHG